MHRDHQAPEGSWCRVTWSQLEHGDVARALGAAITDVVEFELAIAHLRLPELV